SVDVPPGLLLGPCLGNPCVLGAHRLPPPPHAASGRSHTLFATLGRPYSSCVVPQSIGLSPSASAAGVFYAVTTHVEQLGHERLHPVFLLDEAHLLHHDVLDHLHILLNYQWDSKALLSLVLVGLPELEDRLARPAQRSLSP